MTPVSVWAPVAQRVQIDLAAGRFDMRRDGEWWIYDGEVEHGARYAFVVDDSQPLPDPRSAYQPEGVHGPSERFDTDTLDFTDSSWRGLDVREAIIYELHIGTFTPAGTLAAAAEKLEYLRDLGITMIELMPVAAFEGERGWGYDGVDLYAVHRAYGGPKQLAAFVDRAHGLGLAVCLDVVYNHLGPSGNYLPRFGPYFTSTHPTPWGDAVNLDAVGCGQVRRFIIDNALRWLRDFHLDALRLDAVHALVDDSERHILAELSDEVAALSDELARPLSLIAESDANDFHTVLPTAAGGRGMTAQWDDDLHHAIYAYLSGERQGYYGDFGSLHTLAKTFCDGFFHNGTYSSFRGRVWGRPVPGEFDPRQLVAFSLDHDQVGNRGLGDRPASRLTQAELAIAAALVLCGPYTPMLFMGQEWAATTPWKYFTDHQDPELAQAVRTGRAREFTSHGWEEIYPPGSKAADPQARQTMLSSRLDWNEADTEVGRRMRRFYRRLIAIRSGAAGSRATRMEEIATTTNEQEEFFVLAFGDIRLVFTRRDSTAQVRVPVAGAHTGSVKLSWSGSVSAADGFVTMSGTDVAVLRLSE